MKLKREFTHPTPPESDSEVVLNQKEWSKSSLTGIKPHGGSRHIPSPYCTVHVTAWTKHICVGLYQRRRCQLDWGVSNNVKILHNSVCFKPNCTCAVYSAISFFLPFTYLLHNDVMWQCDCQTTPGYDSFINTEYSSCIFLIIVLMKKKCRVSHTQHCSNSYRKGGIICHGYKLIFPSVKSNYISNTDFFEEDQVELWM